ncbi:hypothetical protein D3C81_1192900 [compost metagenome]
MQLLQRDFGVFHDRTLGHLHLQQRRIQTGFVQHTGHLPVELTLAEQTAGDVDRNELEQAPVSLPTDHLAARLAQHPGIDVGNQPGTLGDRDEFAWRHQATLRVLPTHQCLHPDHLRGEQVEHRLVEHP